jgi:hypothetical protein
LRVAGNAQFDKNVAAGPNPDSLFNSASPYQCAVLGSQLDGLYDGFGQGAALTFARATGSHTAPVLAPYSGVAGYDIATSFRSVAIGGGFFGQPDSMRVDIYTAPAYTETVDTGVLRFFVGPDGVTVVVGALSPSPPTTSTGGTFVVWQGKTWLNGALAQDRSMAVVIAGNTDNWNPSVAGTTLAQTRVIKVNVTGAFNLTGMVAQTDGTTVTIFNVNASNTLTLTNQDAGSTGANQFLLPSSGTYTLGPLNSVTLWYDGSTAAWRVMK